MYISFWKRRMTKTFFLACHMKNINTMFTSCIWKGCEKNWILVKRERNSVVKRLTYWSRKVPQRSFLWSWVQIQLQKSNINTRTRLRALAREKLAILHLFTSENTPQLHPKFNHDECRRSSLHRILSPGILVGWHCRIPTSPIIYSGDWKHNVNINI